MTNTPHTRTSVTTAETHPIHVRGAESELAVVFHDEWDAPRVVVMHPAENPREDVNAADWYDLSAVTTKNHEWIDDDDIRGVGLVEIEQSGDIDNINIAGVARGMVAVDYADHVDDTPRLLIFLDHTDDDQTPLRIPL